MVVEDLTGRNFGRLTIISRAENDKYGNTRWNCKCACGAIKTIPRNALMRGLTVSCGCYHKEDVAKRQTTHGESKTKLFREWQYMKRRCYQKTYKFYSYYGGRGISVDEKWVSSYLVFKEWAISHGYQEGLTLDRIDTNGNYTPDNCRWVTRKIQMSNTRATHLFTIKDETHSLTEWARIYNVPTETLRRRVIDKGWDIEKALTTPALDAHGNPRKRSI